MPTPMRTLRVEDELWARVTAAAEARGWSRADIIRGLIRDHLPPRDRSS